ncbi:xylulokinase [Specibacter cremeus]|uniref:xylulokinase n=1 Tax=Specibacter cremeus TaxID=1629051 RepID=UPI000F790724|nr:FGGY family carbohydrate kinase [Specibacter cremeus]
MSSPTPILLGIDVGTSSVKVVSTDLDGRLVDEGHWAYPTAIDGNEAEQDANAWWDGVRALTPDIVAGHSVLGVAVTSQAPTLVAVDAAGDPVTPALTWLDRRALAEAREIRELIPDDRNGADPFFGTAKLLWWQRNRPDVVGRAAHVLATNGFIVHRLTGAATLDDSTASLMQGFDQAADAMDHRLAGAGVATHLLGTVRKCTDIVGTVTAAAAAATGIPAGTPVAAGAIDSVGTALEAGVLRSGDPFVEMTGFSTVGMLAVPRGTAVDGFIHARHCFDDVDLLISAQVTSGAVVDWLTRLIPGTDLKDSDELLARARPSRLTMVPSLAGERTPTWNASARGILDGIDLTVDGYDLMLAAMEGSALMLAVEVARLAERGFTIDAIRATGGGSASRAWLQIKADAMGIPVHRPRSGHGAAQGASYLAGLAVGQYDGVTRLRSFAADVEATFEPVPAKHEDYRRKMADFRRAADLNEDRRAR